MAIEDKVFLVMVGLGVLTYLLYVMTPDNGVARKPTPTARKQTPVKPLTVRPATRAAVRRTETFQHRGGMTVAQWIKTFGYPAKIENGYGYQTFLHRHPITGVVNQFVFRGGLLTDWTSAG